jgi:hypothetical protein
VPTVLAWRSDLSSSGAAIGTRASTALGVTDRESLAAVREHRPQTPQTRNHAAKKRDQARSYSVEHSPRRAGRPTLRLRQGVTAARSTGEAAIATRATRGGKEVELLTASRVGAARWVEPSPRRACWRCTSRSSSHRARLSLPKHVGRAHTAPLRWRPTLGRPLIARRQRRPSVGRVLPPHPLVAMHVGSSSRRGARMATHIGSRSHHVVTGDGRWVELLTAADRWRPTLGRALTARRQCRPSVGELSTAPSCRDGRWVELTPCVTVGTDVGSSSPPRPLVATGVGSISRPHVGSSSHRVVTVGADVGSSSHRGGGSGGVEGFDRECVACSAGRAGDECRRCWRAEPRPHRGRAAL